MNQDEIRDYFGSNPAVVVQIASSADGSPEIAWGDTFFYIRDDSGEARKMPFTTIVTKDYSGFDSASNLNRGGLYRLNMEVGKEKFRELFGIKPSELEDNRGQFDFEKVDGVFPHPLYGSSGWISIINPGEASAVAVKTLLDFSLDRALRQKSPPE